MNLLNRAAALRLDATTLDHAMTADDLIRSHRRLLAEIADPSGGADLGFVWTTSGWQRTRGGVTILIRAKNIEGDERWVRAKFRASRRIGLTDYFTYARDAMEAK